MFALDGPRGTSVLEAVEDTPHVTTESACATIATVSRYLCIYTNIYPTSPCCSLPPGLWPLLLEPDGGLPRRQGEVPQADTAAPAAVVLLQGQERPPGGVRPAPRQAGLPGAILPQRV